MPLIEITTLADPMIDRAAIGQTLNAAVAEAIGARLDAVWTTWRTIDIDVRGADTAGTARGHGPIVHVFHHRTAEQVERIVDTVQRVVARELSIEPGDVFVTTQPVELPDPTLA